LPVYLRLILLFVGVPAVLIQVRKPTRWIGRLMLWSMNRSHSSLTDWGLSHIPIARDACVLDVGCGGGRTLSKLATMAARVQGVDYSAESVAVSRQTNADAIKQGRMDVRQASVASLPFADATFDVVTAVETHYYWPNLVENLQEIRRVLRPGGSLAVIAESYKGGKYGAVGGVVMTLLRAGHLTAGEHRAALAAAGFADIVISEDRSRGWICAAGKRPL
jgi:SAM-dependent methyltransferase